MRNQNRVIIEHLTPVIDGGIFQLKRVQAQSVHVEADILSDGHDHLSAELIFTHNSSQQKEVVSMESLPNDRWQADFKVTELGNYHFHLEAWVDEPLTWLYGTQKKLEAQQDKEEIELDSVNPEISKQINEILEEGDSDNSEKTKG